MQYQIGDTVAFQLPAQRPADKSFLKRGAPPGGTRFDIGIVQAFLEADGAYRIRGLTGGQYTIQESQISGRTEGLRQAALCGTLAQGETGPG